MLGCENSSFGTIFIWSVKYMFMSKFSNFFSFFQFYLLTENIFIRKFIVEKFSILQKEITNSLLWKTIVWVQWNQNKSYKSKHFFKLFASAYNYLICNDSFKTKLLKLISIICINSKIFYNKYESTWSSRDECFLKMSNLLIKLTN